MTVRALIFDAYGTLYDVQSVRQRAVELCGDKGDLITQLWRLKQLEYSWLLGLMGDYRDFWSVTRASLEFALESAGFAPSAALCEPLMNRYLNLDLFPEARTALSALGQYRLAILSNGSPKMLEALTAASGIAPLLSAVISVDQAQTFKPDPKCYALVAPALGVSNDEVLFVSSNGFDVAGAKSFGFKVAWIDRNAGSAPTEANTDPAEFYKLLRSRPEALGHPPDFRIGALTDLVRVLSDLA